MAVTYSDIACHAGVSTATVSRVLAGSGTVSARLAARVRDSADALGHRTSRRDRGSGGGPVRRGVRGDRGDRGDGGGHAKRGAAGGLPAGGGRGAWGQPGDRRGQDA